MYCRSLFLSDRDAPGGVQLCPSVDAEQDDECGLHRVNDQGEHDGGFFSDAVEDEHRFHGKVPWSGTVGGGNQHGERSDAENEERLIGKDAGGGVEAEEGDVEMEEIAHPNQHAVEEIEREISDFLQ